MWKNCKETEGIPREILIKYWEKNNLRFPFCRFVFFLFFFLSYNDLCCAFLFDTFHIFSLLLWSGQGSSFFFLKLNLVVSDVLCITHRLRSSRWNNVLGPRSPPTATIITTATTTIKLPTNFGRVCWLGSSKYKHGTWSSTKHGRTVEEFFELEVAGKYSLNFQWKKSKGHAIFNWNWENTN